VLLPLTMAMLRFAVIG